MNEAEAWRIAILAMDYDALAFIWVGKVGLQPVLMPNEVYRWRDARSTGNRRTDRKASRRTQARHDPPGGG